MLIAHASFANARTSGKTYVWITCQFPLGRELTHKPCKCALERIASLVALAAFISASTTFLRAWAENSCGNGGSSIASLAHSAERAYDGGVQILSRSPGLAPGFSFKTPILPSE